MTKREICERLIHTRDIMASLAKIVAEDRLPFNLDEVGKCGDFLRDILLDLAAPEEEAKPETPEAEEKHPGIWMHPCPKCGTSSPRAAHMDGYTYYCPKCKQYFVDAAGELKRGEGEK